MIKQTLWIASLLAVVLFVFFSCKKGRATSYMNTAIITSWNITTPFCGAPFQIVIHGLADSNAQFETLPASSNIDPLTSVYPINVKLNWHRDTVSGCPGANNIVVDAIEKVN